MRTYDSRQKKSSIAPLVQTQVLKTRQSQPQLIQAKSNEGGLAEHAERLKKFQQLGTPWMDKLPNLSGDLVKPWIQRKLTLGQPGDKYEREADRVASQVVQQINAPAFKENNLRQSIQREKDLEGKLQARCFRAAIQRQQAIVDGETSPDLESAINSARGDGQPLDSGLQKSMGQVMGADFSGVRVHTDAKSDQMNQSIQARAFTTGQDVFFREGAYQPGSRGGQELIAHELTHIVHQGCNHQMQRKVVKVNHKEGKEKTSFDYVASAEVNSMVEALKQDTGQKEINFYKDQEPYLKSEEHYFAGHGGNNDTLDDMESSEFAGKIKDRVEDNAVLHIISCALGQGEEESFAAKVKDEIGKNVTVTGAENFVYYSKNIKAIYEEPDISEDATDESFEDKANPIFKARNKAEEKCDRDYATKIAKDINARIETVIQDYDKAIQSKDEETIKKLHSETKIKILNQQQVDEFAKAVLKDETLQKDKVSYRALDHEWNDPKKIKNYAAGLKKAILSLSKKNQGFLKNVETIINQFGDQELTTKVETQIKDHKQQSEVIWQTFGQDFEKLLNEWNKKGGNVQEAENLLEDEVESEDENEVEIATTLQKHLEKYKRFE